MTDTINNKIPFVPENAIDPAAGLNLSLNTIDALVQVLVQTVGANTPPTGVEGNRHIVGTAPTGAWAGQANKLARFLGGAWQFFDARHVLNAADGLWYVRSGSTWAPLAGGGGGGGEVNTASNLGAGEGVFASKVGVDLRFKSLVAGTNITLSSDGDEITIDAAGGGGGSGTVTSVGLSAPTGFDVAGSPVTASGTLALSFSTGYSLPTDANQTNWSTAFGWGDHATAGYEKELTAGANISIDRTDPDNPVISASASSGMTNPMTTSGDIIVGGASGAPTRLAKGTDGQLLLMASGVQAYGSNPILAGYKETLETMASNVIDVSTSNVKKRVLTANATFTITGATSGFSHTVTLHIEGGNTYSVAWPAAFKWLIPIPTLTAKHIVSGYTIDGGTTWLINFEASYV